MEMRDLVVQNGVNGVDLGPLKIDFVFFGGLQFENGQYALFASVVESVPTPKLLILVFISMVGFFLSMRMRSYNKQNR
jgi:hypothetical protein